MYDHIFFDLDGTLYDISDVASSVYDAQVRFLSEELHTTKNEAVQMLEANHLYPVMKDDSRSATAFFSEIGLDRVKWTGFKERFFRASNIDKRKAAKEDDLLRISRIAPLILVSSNTYRNVLSVLTHIEIDAGIFSSIVTSDTSDITPFSKKNVFAAFKGKLLSIGDRYETDIVPMLLCSGVGMLVNGPDAIPNVSDDLTRGEFRENGYKFYRGAR